MRTAVFAIVRCKRRNERLPVAGRMEIVSEELHAGPALCAHVERSAGRTRPPCSRRGRCTGHWTRANVPTTHSARRQNAAATPSPRVRLRRNRLSAVVNGARRYRRLSYQPPRPPFTIFVKRYIFVISAVRFLRLRNERVSRPDADKTLRVPHSG